MSRQRIASIFAALATVVLALGALLGVLVAEEDAPATRTVTAVPIPGGPDPVIDPNQEFAGNEAAEAADPEPDAPVLHEDAVDEEPAAAAKAVESAEEIETADPLPAGGAEVFSCPWRPVVNHSSREGAKVVQFVVHYTVSRPGTLDVIRNLFNTPSFGASSTFGLEVSGRCETWVDPDRKPWTQRSFNPVSESVEIIAMGTESRRWWLERPIFTKGILAHLIVDRLRARGLPPRFVDPEGCTAKAGWTDHDHLECTNTHHDVAPNFPLDVLADQVKRFHLAETKIAVWQVRSGGELLKQLRASTIDGLNGYERTLRWMREHPGIVRRAEKDNGFVAVRKVAVESSA